MPQHVRQSHPHARLGRLVAATAAVMLGLGLVACAPLDGGDDGKPTTQGSDEGSWGQGETPSETPEVVELPSGFPTEEFPLPDDAVLADAGARASGGWFVVLRASSPAEAEEWWAAIIDAGGFAVRAEEASVDGGKTATLVSDSLSAEALTIPDPDGSVLMSYDLSLSTV